MSLRECDCALTIRTFGGFQLTRSQTSVPLSEWKLHKSLQLFKYLLVHRGRPVSVPQLLGVFWPDMTEERGRRNLQATLYVLRRVLEPDLGAYEVSSYLVHEKGQYTLRLGPHVWLDDVFESHIRMAAKMREENPDAAREHLKKALKLYHDRFLPEDVYEDWTVYPREYYHDLFVKATLDYAELEAQAGNLNATIRACRKALAQDPYLEEMHRALMIYYWSADRRLDAIQQYRHCQRMLEQEFGVSPSRRRRSFTGRSCGRRPAAKAKPTPGRSPPGSSPIVLRGAGNDNPRVIQGSCQPTVGWEG